jgi:hypothetical protein
LRAREKPKQGGFVKGVTQPEKMIMRTVIFAAILLGSSSLQPLLAQDQPNSPSSSQPQTVPVQPERTPQQSEQSREQDRDRAEDVRVGRDWRTEERDGYRGERMGRNDEGRASDRMRRDMDRDRSTVGRNWRARPEDEHADREGYGRGYYNEDRARRRVKICYEYQDGDEYCRYTD